MFIKQNAYRNITIITAIAVFWVFLGALLNFHANRILGTELIDHAYPAIKPKTKEHTVQLSELTKQSAQLDLFSPKCEIDLADLLLPAALVKKQESALSFYLKVRTYQFGLRAPPTV
jgi:hypothetical protein